MRDIEIKITKSTRFVDFKTEVIGNDGESLQSKLIFTFKDEFVDGQARLEYEINCEKYYAQLEKIGKSYEIPIKSVMTKQGSINMQLVITQGTDENEIPIFKSNKFFLTCNESINAEIEEPQQYNEWIDVANTKLNQLDEGLVEIETQSSYAKEQGDYAKQEGAKVDEVINYVVKTSEEANDKSDTAISIAKGANQALDYLDYQNMIINFNAFEKEKFMTGQQIMIKKLNVPDIWIYQLTEEYKYYTYTTDEEVIDLLLSENGFHVGYYVLSALETQKVDLTEYVKNTDVATGTTLGLVMANVQSDYGVGVQKNGTLYIQSASKSHIDLRQNPYMPIVPSTLDYAVKSVVGGHVTLTQTEYDALEIIDENTYYYIKEEK